MINTLTNFYSERIYLAIIWKYTGTQRQMFATKPSPDSMFTTAMRKGLVRDEKYMYSP